MNCPLCKSNTHVTYDSNYRLEGIISEGRDCYICSKCDLTFDYGNFYIVDFRLKISDRYELAYYRKSNMRLDGEGIYLDDMVARTSLFLNKSDFIEFVKKHNSKEDILKFLSLA